MTAKNIVIFSDGTGQRGGIFVDEKRSNVYKLYRATRCGPDSIVDPKLQLAFYDPGIGTLPPGAGFIGTLWRRIYNLISQALGLGLTGNIIDCYAAIIRLASPGDQIFLFGFSRGAYTARCLGGVIGMCGLPTRMKDQGPLRRDEETSKQIAREAVKRVYQHTSSWKPETATDRQKQLLAQRTELARRFREIYGSGDANDRDKANVYPHFIGVFDTVASLANPAFLTALIAASTVLLLLLSTFLWWSLSRIGIPAPWWAIALGLLGGVAIVALCVNLTMRIKSERGLPFARKPLPFHLTEARMNFYDTQLNPNVHFARHALSIDERRDSFERVPWGDPKSRRVPLPSETSPEPIWFEQLWFSGNHSDIGGSYNENESRLSDISLRWMIEAAGKAGLAHNYEMLRLFPDPAGPQHDETKSSIIFSRASHSPRRIRNDAHLHDSVIERFEAGPVLQYDLLADYRPENLREHPKTRQFYDT